MLECRGDSLELLPHFSFLIGTCAMATESEAGVKLPPGVGVLTYNVVKTRPDLYDMVGFTVRVPRSLDIEADDGLQRVWVPLASHRTSVNSSVSLVVRNSVKGSKKQ